MKIDYISDTHMEFWRKGGTSIDLRADNGTVGDVLVLAGDVLCARYFDEKRTDKRSRQSRELFYDFFTQASEMYKTVLYVLGNHEAYGMDLDESRALIQSSLWEYKNVHVLENTSIKVGDTLFLGATIWTDYGREDPIAMFNAQRSMNDYRVISVDGDKRKALTPEYIVKRHKESVLWLDKELKAVNEADKIVVITHHAPTYHAHDNAHAPSPLIDSFHVNLEHFMTRDKKVDAWIFGHTHYKYKQDIHGTTVCSNPFGYIGHEPSTKTWVPERITV